MSIAETHSKVHATGDLSVKHGFPWAWSQLKAGKRVRPATWPSGSCLSWSKEEGLHIHRIHMPTMCVNTVDVGIVMEDDWEEVP